MNIFGVSMQPVPVITTF